MRQQNLQAHLNITCNVQMARQTNLNRNITILQIASQGNLNKNIINFADRKPWQFECKILHL